MRYWHLCWPCSAPDSPRWLWPGSSNTACKPKVQHHGFQNCPGDNECLCCCLRTVPSHYHTLKHYCSAEGCCLCEVLGELYKGISGAALQEQQTEQKEKWYCSCPEKGLISSSRDIEVWLAGTGHDALVWTIENNSHNSKQINFASNSYQVLKACIHRQATDYVLSAGILAYGKK